MEVVRAHQTSGGGGGSETAGEGGGGSRPVSIEEKEEVNARQTGEADIWSELLIVIRRGQSPLRVQWWIVDTCDHHHHHHFGADQVTSLLDYIVALAP